MKETMSHISYHWTQNAGEQHYLKLCTLGLRQITDALGYQIEVALKIETSEGNSTL